MPRKKGKFYLYLPESLYKYVGVNDSGEATSYKVAHFLSILTHHVYINHQKVKAYWKKDISSDFLKEMYTTSYSKDVIIPLIEDGIIIADGSYSVGNFPKSYSLNKMLIEEVIQDKYSRVFITNNTLIQKINNWRRGTLSRQIEQYFFIEKEAEMLLHLNIDRAVLEQLFDSRVEAIQNAEYKKKRIALNNAVRGQEEIVALTEAKDLLDARVRYSSGRVYHPLVNCPKEFRTAVVDDDNQPYVEIDLRSSQAVFLCKVIAVALRHRLITYEFGKQATASDNLIEQIIPLLDESINVLEQGVYPRDFTAFVSAVFLDDIYEDSSPENISQSASVQVGEDVYEVGGYTRVSGAKTLVGEARKEAKEQFFKDIFFNYYNKENHADKGQLSISSEYLEDFAKTYYTVYEFCRICALQSKEGKKKSRDLALLLQQTESKFFHELLPSALSHIEPFNYFVVHDAVYVPQKPREAVINACNEEAVKFFGVAPMFR